MRRAQHRRPRTRAARDDGCRAWATAAVATAHRTRFGPSAGQAPAPASASSTATRAPWRVPRRQHGRKRSSRPPYLLPTVYSGALLLDEAAGGVARRVVERVAQELAHGVSGQRRLAQLPNGWHLVIGEPAGAELAQLFEVDGRTG